MNKVEYKPINISVEARRTTDRNGNCASYGAKTMRNLAEIRAHMAYNAVLVGILVVYGLFGAFVFRKLEALERVSASNDHLGISKDELLKELWNQKDLEFDKWSEQAKNKLDSYENTLMSESSNPADWSLADSWLFACTIFTTIGKKRHLDLIY